MHQLRHFLCKVGVTHNMGPKRKSSLAEETNSQKWVNGDKYIIKKNPIIKSNGNTMMFLIIFFQNSFAPLTLTLLLIFKIISLPLWSPFKKKKMHSAANQFPPCTCNLCILQQTDGRK